VIPTPPGVKRIYNPDGKGGWTLAAQLRPIRTYRCRWHRPRCQDLATKAVRNALDEGTVKEYCDNHALMALRAFKMTGGKEEG